MSVAFENVLNRRNWPSAAIWCIQLDLRRASERTKTEREKHSIFRWALSCLGQPVLLLTPAHHSKGSQRAFETHRPVRVPGQRSLAKTREPPLLFLLSELVLVLVLILGPIRSDPIQADPSRTKPAASALCEPWQSPWLVMPVGSSEPIFRCSSLRPHTH